jgi:TBC1 domain family member 14
MTFATKELPKLPSVSEDDNLQEICLDRGESSINSSSHISVPRKSFPTSSPQSFPSNIVSPSNLSSHSLHSTTTPSPLKNQVPVSRTSSVTSTSSSRSKKSTNMFAPAIQPSHSYSSPEFMVQMEKTPANLTPSQRLKMRKSQLSTSIAKFKEPTHVLKKPIIFNDDEELDDDDIIFNVPLSQSLASINHREKFTFGNNDRKLSLNTESTRSSSILSHASFNDSDSTSSSESKENFNKSSVSVNDLHLSKDAHELSLLFNQDDYIQIFEESRQRKLLLSNFTKISASTPTSPAEEYFSHRDTSRSKVSLGLHSASSPAVNYPKYASQENISTTRGKIVMESRSVSNPSLPLPLPHKHNTPLSTASVSKYYSFTRPTWLPPKSTLDKKKHQSESQEIIQLALYRESQQQIKKLQRLDKLRILKERDLQSWYSILDIIDPKEYKSLITKVDGIWWRGIPQEVRSRIWWNNFRFTDNLKFDFGDYYFDMFDNCIDSRINELNELYIGNNKLKSSVERYKRTSGCNLDKDTPMYAELVELNLKIKRSLATKVGILDLTMSSIKPLYDLITNDLLDVYPDLNYFQNYEVVHSLTRIVICLILYLYKNSNQIDLSNYYFPGLNHLVAVFYFNYRNPFKTFISMVQVYQHQLQNLLLSFKFSTSTSIEHKILANSIDDYFIKEFDLKFAKNLNQLYTHFRIVDLKTLDFLPTLALGLFCNSVNFLISSCLVDIFIFEKNDDFFVKLILGFFKTIQHKLFGTKDEILARLGAKSASQSHTNDEIYRYLNVGNEYDFLETVANIEL